MPSSRREDSDGHIPVHWLDKELPPTRWERWDRHWLNLPAALLVVLVVLAVVVPAPSIPTPSISIPAPDISLASVIGGDDGDDEPTAAELAKALQIATPPPPPVSAGPGPQKEMATRSASVIPELATLSQTKPNELGGVPIIMYHAFVHDPAYTDEWTLTFDQFRAQLDWFRENDFVMVGMQSMIDGRFDVPAGKRPIILTFDDASAGQFGLQEAPGGGYEVKPDTAVGVLEEYAKQYPEFAGPAFFAVLPWNCFESEDDPSTCEERLNWLIEHDYEIGNHTYDHVDMTDVSPEFFTESIGSMKNWINERIPQGPGNLSEVLVMPFGAFPDWDLHPDQRSWLAEGFWYLGEPVNLDLVLAVNGGPAISPYSVSFFPAETYRIASEPGVLAYWQEQIASGATPVFVSDGNPETVTVPASYQDEGDTEQLDHKGLQLRAYEDE